MMQNVLEATKSWFKNCQRRIQSSMNRQVEFAHRHLPELGATNKFLTWPNLISLTRVPLAEAIAFWHLAPAYIPAAILLLAAYTDAFDGMLARRIRQETVSGAIIDPTADKYLVIRCLIIYRLSLWPHLAWAVIVTDSLIFFLPMLGLVIGFLDPNKIPFNSTIVGKTKLLFQCIGVAAVVVGLKIFASAVFTVALGIALWSIYDKISEVMPLMWKK